MTEKVKQQHMFSNKMIAGILDVYKRQVLIMTYYAVIGGWILRYIVIYLTSSGKQAVADDCFTAFISSPSSVWYGLIFMLLTALIVYNGVEAVYYTHLDFFYHGIRPFGSNLSFG